MSHRQLRRWLAAAAAACLTPVGLTTITSTAQADDADPSYVVNGHQLNETQIENVNVLADTYDRLQGDRDQRLRTLAVGTWWTLKEGPASIPMTEADGFSLCHEMPADAEVRHDGEPLYSCSGQIWQVGVTGTQVLAVTQSEQPVEEEYLGTSEQDAITESLELNGIDPSGETGQAVLGSNDTWLKDAWLARHPVIGLRVTASAAQQECLDPETSGSAWCFSVLHEGQYDTWDTERWFAYDRETATRSIDDLTALYDQLVPADGSTEPAPTDPAPVTATVADTGGVGLRVRAGIDTSSEAVGMLQSGDTITIECQVEGEHVTNDVTGWESSLWDKVDGGYVSDAWVDTGVDGPIEGVPTCGSDEPAPTEPVPGADGCQLDHPLPDGATSEDLVAGIEENWSVVLQDDASSWMSDASRPVLESWWTTLDEIDCTPFFTTVVEGHGGQFVVNSTPLYDPEMGVYWGHYDRSANADLDINTEAMASTSPELREWNVVHELAHGYYWMADQGAAAEDLYAQGAISQYGAAGGSNENYSDVLGLYVARCAPDSWSGVTESNPYDEGYADQYAFAKDVFGGVEFNEAGPGEAAVC